VREYPPVEKLPTLRLPVIVAHPEIVIGPVKVTLLALIKLPLPFKK
jgi:hypothetical protein